MEENRFSNVKAGHEHTIWGLGVYERSRIVYENYPKNTVTRTGPRKVSED